jgi:ADP-heptose:LPS heptosyltransferase
MMHPDAEIVVQTAYPDVFRWNPNVDQVVSGAPDGSFYRMIDLDLAYEKLPNLHIVEAYMEEAFGDVGRREDLQQELFTTKVLSPPLFGDRKRYVAVHATVAGWANRTLSRSTWTEVIKLLRAAGLWPILVGSPRDDLPSLAVTRFITTDIAALVALISGVGCFVGSDSGVLHVAGATDTPIVGVFTCAKPDTRLPIRGGIIGKDCRAIEPDLDCKGCLARRPPPVTAEFCERGDNACVDVIQAADIADAVFDLINKARE